VSTAHRQVRIQGSQRGFTLIEIMIALLISIFLLGALLTIVQANRAVFGDQSQLAQLQDSERMALTMMTDVIQQAGYFPDPTTNTVLSTLTAVAPFAVGQAISGTYTATVPGDSIFVRYMTAGGDGILNCSGLPNPVAGPNTLYVNKFYINNGQLVCDMTANAITTTYNLVSGVTNSSTNLGVTNLTVLYGVKANAALPGNNVDTYLNASLMTPANWGSVIAVLIQLTFTNPLYTAGSTTQPPTILVQRVVGVMNQLGPIQ
jgi:type IV pilus assembly protein PilW